MWQREATLGPRVHKSGSESKICDLGKVLSLSVPDFLICNQNHLKELPKMRKTYPSIYSSSCCGAGIPSAVIIVTWIFGCFSWCELCCWFASGRNMWIWPSLCPLLPHTTKTPALVRTEREMLGAGEEQGRFFSKFTEESTDCKKIEHRHFVITWRISVEEACWDLWQSLEPQLSGQGGAWRLVCWNKAGIFPLTQQSGTHQVRALKDVLVDIII